MSVSKKEGKDNLFCSFCWKPQTKVKTLIAGAGANICEDCIDTCIATFRDQGILD